MAISLEDYIAATASSAKSSLIKHPEHANVLRLANETFDHVLQFLAKSPEGIVVFAAMAHADLLAASRAALGGELPTSFMASRSCVEDALYAFYLHRKPELKEVWAQRHDSPDAKKRVRKAFVLKDMKDTLTTYISSVGEQASYAYETAIDMGAHPNVMKVFANLTVGGDTPEIEWQYINVDAVDVSIALRVSAMSGMAALNIFKEIWPLTFGSTDASALLHQMHEAFIKLPGFEDAGA